jgi:hypothetical protein
MTTGAKLLDLIVEGVKLRNKKEEFQVSGYSNPVWYDEAISRIREIEDELTTLLGCVSEGFTPLPELLRFENIGKQTYVSKSQVGKFEISPTGYLWRLRLNECWLESYDSLWEAKDGAQKHYERIMREEY